MHVPPDYAAEMVPFDPLVGEFRVHYAGFFDPGFGHSAAGGTGSRAVLEVRSREVPFLLGHGQTIGRLVYEKGFQLALEAATRGRTTFVIAHRLATIRQATWILVFDGGRIVEQGTFAQLQAEGGAFARLARAHDVEEIA